MCLTEPLGMQGIEIINVKTECEFIKRFAIFSNQILIAFMLSCSALFLFMSRSCISQQNDMNCISCLPSCWTFLLLIKSCLFYFALFCGLL